MRIPYLNIPCILNETCFHGRCIHVEDFLLGWYEFCLCNYNYSGYECNETTKFNRTDRFIVLSCVVACLCICLCFACLPVFYKFLLHDFYPKIIECARATPYVEINSSNLLAHSGTRIYRIPSENLIHRRTVLDGLIPLHSISSLAAIRRYQNVRSQARNERLHLVTNI